MKGNAILGLATILIAITIGLQAQTCTDIPPGLVAWWRAENNAQDALGNNHGTLQNGAVYNAGWVGQAFDLDGLGARIEIADSAVLKPANVTVEAWVKFDTQDTPGASALGLQYIVFKKNTRSSSFEGYALVKLRSAGIDKLYFFVSSASGTQVGLASTNAVVVGQWYHVAGTYDGSIAKLYVDGVLHASQAASFPLDYGTRPVFIGSSGETTVGNLDGVVDEVAIYNRALTANEVAAIFSAGSAGKCVQPYFLTSSLPDGMVGAPYSSTFNVAITPGPHMFSLVNGSLPPGLTLAASGLISGTPVSDSSNSFTVQAVSSLDQTNSKTFTLRTYDAPQGMIAWWRGQNDAKDALGTHHGTLAGNATYVAGKVGQGFSFDGSGDFVQVPNVPALNYGFGDFTAELWVRFTATGGEQVLVEMFTGSGGPGWTFSKLGNNQLHFFITGAGISSPVQSIPSGVWHHFVARRASGVGAIFMNGTLVHQATLAGNADSSSPFMIGSRNGSSFFLNGQADEVTLYNRALTNEEIMAIYNAGTAGKNTEHPYFLTPNTLPVGGVGTPYSLQITAAVTPGPHTFTITGGTLPSGLELSSSGLLYGTPTVSTTNNLTVLATSSLGQTNTRIFTLSALGCLDPTPSGMVAWWRGQDDALDAAGNHHGTLQNGATYAAGKVGRSFSFDGVNDHLTASASGLPQGNAARTVECWMNTTAVNAKAPIIYGGYAAGNAFYPIVLSSKVWIGWWGGGDVSGTKIVSDGQWHHVAMAYDGAGTTRLYVDGVLDATASGRSYGTVASTVYLGGAFGADTLFPGKVDELAVFNRALSATEILSIYNAGVAGKSGMLYLATPSPLPNAGQGAAYSQALAATGGAAPYGFTLLSGTLPAGLTLSGDGEISGTPSGFGFSDFTVRVTDAQTRPADRHFSLKVNARPALSAIADQSWNELAMLTVTNSATDADPLDTLSYALLDAPAGAEISSTGVITWTPDESQGPAAYVFTTVATDDGQPSLSATNSFTVVVNELNTAPVLTLPANTNIDELVAYSANATATDADIPINALTFALVSGPAGLTVSPTGLIEWTPDEGQGHSTNTVIIRVTDLNSPAVNDISISVTNSFQIVVNEVNAAPVLLVLSDTNLNELTTMTATNTATDSDLPANPLTYLLLTSPVGAGIDTNGVITWTPAEEQGPSTNIFTTVVTDTNSLALYGQSLSTTNTFTVVVGELNIAPVLTLPVDTNINELVAYTAVATAMDADLPTNALSFALVSGPAGLSVSPSGDINWTPTEAQGPGTYQVFISVTDTNPPAVNATSLSVTSSFSITVNEVNVAPALTPPANQTINEGVGYAVNAAGSDADEPVNPLNFELISGPVGLTVSPAGAIAWTPEENQGPGTNLIVLRLSDTNPPAVNATSLSVTNSYQLVVREVNTSPVLTLPGNTNIDELVAFAADATATDADDPANALAFALVSGPAGLSVSPAGSISWTPTEAQGPSTNTVLVSVTDTNPAAVNATSLSVTGSFEIVVHEMNTAPVISLPANTNLNELVVFAALATATDADEPTNARTFALVSGPLGLSVSPAGLINWTPSEDQGPSTNTVTISITDTNEVAVNVTSLSVTSSFQIVVSEVNVAPILGALTDRTVNPGQTISFTATATDADLPANALSYTLVNPPPGADITGDGQFTWRPGVALRNTTNTVQLRVQDNGAPVSNDTRSFNVVINPLAPVVLTPIVYTNGEFRINVDGTPGPDYILISTTNFLDWSALATNISPAVPFQFSDPAAGVFDNRFYRVRLEP